MLRARAGIRGSIQTLRRRADDGRDAQAHGHAENRPHPHDAAYGTHRAAVARRAWQGARRIRRAGDVSAVRGEAVLDPARVRLPEAPCARCGRRTARDGRSHRVDHGIHAGHDGRRGARCRRAGLRARLHGDARFRRRQRQAVSVYGISQYAGAWDEKRGRDGQGGRYGQRHPRRKGGGRVHGGRHRGKLRSGVDAG